MSHRRRGFTLIELLIVVVVIGILAAIAIPSFKNTKGKAFLASMKSDLRNLAVAEESYFYDKHAYTAVLDSMQFVSSPGVVITVVEATSNGWSATSMHPDAYPHLCAIFFGAATPVDPATDAGTVACK